MKKIIDGKTYDTEKAELIKSWENGFFVGDLKYRSKDLYRTKKGNWFIYHAGGAMTDMSKSAGNNSYSGSTKIEPVSEDDAFKFLCSHEGTEEAEEYFSEKIEEA